MKEIKRYPILGTKLSLIGKNELLDRISFFLKDKKGHYIVTPNPEIVLLAKRDLQYQKVLNAADISIADGFGLVLAGWLNGIKIPRHTGSGLTPEILNNAEKENRKVMIINLRGGWSPAEEIEKALKKLYPKLQFSVVDVEKQIKIDKISKKKISEFKPEIIFLTLGMHSQEMLIAKYLHRWPTVRLAIGVGGTFDMLTGKAKPAPYFMKKIGMEWLWRIFQNPKRIKRTVIAIPVFLWNVVLDRIKQR